MTSVGSVEVDVKLALEQLFRDARRIEAELKKQIGVPQIDTGDLKKNLFDVANAFQDSISQASLYTQALNQVGQQIGAVGDRINGFADQARQAAIAFDSAQAKVATLSGNSQEIADQMRQLSQELDFQANSTDLLNASYDVLSSGFSETADIAGILKASVDGALGGFSDVGTVADATTTILNSYGDALGENASVTEKAAKVVDILAQTQDKGKITINQYAGQIGQVASIAAGAGVSLEELSAAVATATAKGVPAASSISGVRQAIVNLTKPTDEAQKLLEQYGITNAAATLKSEGLIGVLQRLKDAGLKDSDLGKIFTDVTGLATIAPIAGQNLDQFSANLDAMNNSAGKAAKSAQAVAASFEGQATKAFNQANEALVSLGNGIKGAALPLLQALTFLVENFNRLPEPVKEAVGVAIALTGGLLTLTAALAGIAASLPVVNAGFKALATQSGLAGAGMGEAGVGAVAGAGGLRVMATAVGGLLIKLGLITAAIASVQTALSRFQDGGEGFKTGAGNIEKSLIDLGEAAKQTKTDIENVLPKEPPPTDFVDGIVAKFNELSGLDITTNAEKQINDLRAGLVQFQGSVDGAIAAAQKFKGSQEDAKRVQETLALAIAEANTQLQNLDPAKIGTNAYNELSAGIKATVRQLEAEKGAFEQRTGLVQASTQATDTAVDAEQKSAEAVKQTTEAYAENTAVLEASNQLREAEIKESIARGVTSEKEGQQQLLEQERQYQQERLALAQSQAAQLRDLLSATTDPEKLKELNEGIKDADQTVAEARLAIADSFLKEREAAEKEALENLEAANRESEAAITASQQARITAVKQAQLSGQKTAEEAARAIAQIEQDSIGQTIQARQRELAEVQRLKQEGTISAEEAASREMELNQEIGQLNLQRLDKELEAQRQVEEAAKKAAEEAKKAAIEAIEAAATAARAPLEAGQIELDIAGGALGIESQLLNAQAQQQQAIAEAEQARLGSAIERAKLAGDDVKAEQLRLQQIQAQQAALEQQFTIEQKQLELSQQQRAIELERQKIAAEIAAIEAEVALQKAIANGASEAEIANLQTILGLRQKQVDQARQAESQQSRLNQLENETLQARQEARRTQGATAIAQQQAAIKGAQKQRVEGQADKEGATAIARGPSAEELEKQRIQQGLRNGFNAAGSVRQLKSKVPVPQLQDLRPVADLSGLGSVVQEGNGLVVMELRELKASIMQLANTPRCLSVSAPDPVGAVGQVLADIGRQSFRRSKL